MRINGSLKLAHVKAGRLAVPLQPGSIGPDLIEAAVFGAPPASGDGLINVWSGSAWVAKPVKVWTGSAWVQKPLKFWDGTQWRTMGTAPVGDSPAAWFTPSGPFQVTPNSAPYQYYQCTLAWSHRYEVNTLDYPRAMERVVLADHGWLNVQGDNNDTGLNMTGTVESWGWTQASFTWPSGGFFEPDENANYVLLLDQAGGLSSGHYAQLWRNGILVGYVTTQIPDYGLSNLRLLGEGTTALAGETQGFWWSADTAMDPAVMFDTLFDGANGLLDLADPTIDGVAPDNYQFGP